MRCPSWRTENRSFEANEILGTEMLTTTYSLSPAQPRGYSRGIGVAPASATSLQVLWAASLRAKRYKTKPISLHAFTAFGLVNSSHLEPGYRQNVNLCGCCHTSKAIDSLHDQI